MLPVEIVPFNESVVLRARGSELLILPHHVRELKGKKSPQDFTTYFTGEALINRPARKLFEAWLRKDNTLWPRLYKTVHEEVKLDQEDDGQKGKVETKAGGATKIVNPPKQNSLPKPSAKVADAATKPAAKKAEAKPAAKAEKPEVKAAPKKVEAKPAAKKSEPKAAPKKVEAKPAAKAAPAKKPAPAAKAAPAKKPAAKAAPAKKPAAKAAPAKKGKGK